MTPVFVLGTHPAARRLAELLGASPPLVAVTSSALLGDLADALERNLEGLAAGGFPDQFYRSALGRLYAEIRWGSGRPVEWTGVSPDRLDRLFPRCVCVEVSPRFRRRIRSLPASRWLAITPEAVLEDPEGCVARVLRFLGESGAAPAVFSRAGVR